MYRTPVRAGREMVAVDDHFLRDEAAPVMTRWVASSHRPENSRAGHTLSAGTDKSTRGPHDVATS